MKGKRYTAEQIVAVLKQAELGLPQQLDDLLCQATSSSVAARASRTRYGRADNRCASRPDSSEFEA